jgi:molybdenum cofactor cytidylyltransferase
MGEQDKLLLPWKDKTIIEHLLQVAAGVENMEVLVVTGSLEVVKKAAQLGIESRIPQGEPSQSNSLKTGLTNLPNKGMKGIFFILGDQPFINAELLINMQRAYNYLEKVGSARNIVVPFYHQQRGNPVLFSIDYLDSFYAIAGDQGARSILQAHNKHVFRLKVDNSEMLIDIDTPEDYQQAIKRFPVIKEESIAKLGVK